MLDRREAQVRPSPSRGAGQRVGAVQSLGSMCLAARARAVRPRAAPPGRARGQGSAPIVPRCYCTRFAASAGAIRLSARTSGQRDGAGGGDGAERGTVGTDGTDGTDGADGAGGTTNCSRCADGLRRGLGSFTIGKLALRPWPAAGASHVGVAVGSKRIIFFVFSEKYGLRILLSETLRTVGNLQSS